MTYPIDQMPNLCASLGKAGVDRIRLHQTPANSVGGPRTRWHSNPHWKLLAETQPYGHGFVDDILSGIAALDEDGTGSLNQERLHVLLASNAALSTDLIAKGMNIAPRQARKYMAAAKLAIFHINRHLKANLE